MHRREFLRTVKNGAIIVGAGAIGTYAYDSYTQFRALSSTPQIILPVPQEPTYLAARLDEKIWSLEAGEWDCGLRIVDSITTIKESPRWIRKRIEIKEKGGLEATLSACITIENKRLYKSWDIFGYNPDPTIIKRFHMADNKAGGIVDYVKCEFHDNHRQTFHYSTLKGGFFAPREPLPKDFNEQKLQEIYETALRRILKFLDKHLKS